MTIESSQRRFFKLRNGPARPDAMVTCAVRTLLPSQVRAQLEACPVVLGSATPSVESHANALRGRYQRLSLPRRIGPQGLASVEIVDRRAVPKSGGDPILSPPLREALAERLARREQSLVLLNRRGYATSLLCRECGQVRRCARTARCP